MFSEQYGSGDSTRMNNMNCNLARSCSSEVQLKYLLSGNHSLRRKFEIHKVDQKISG